VPAAVIYDFEGDYGKPKPEDLAALQAALEKVGVEFIEGGVREKQANETPQTATARVRATPPDIL
jgi:hypothetical protein